MYVFDVLCGSVLSSMLQIICDAWVQKSDKAYADAQCSMFDGCMGMCLLCEAYAIHFGILFNFNSTVNWLLVYSFDLRDQNVDFVSKIVCGFVVTKHIAVISAFPRSGIFCLVHFGFCYSFFMF